KPAPPAKVAQAVKETELNTVVLTPEAEKRLRLKIATAEVEDGAVRRLRFYGGEVTLPASALLTVSAPVTGILRAPKDEKLPHVGSAVKQGDAMFTLVPHVLTQAEQVTLAQAKLQLAKAKIDADGWVKVPVYVGEAAEIAEKEPAKITDLGDPSGARGVPANPVKSPPTAQPQASAVDLYYELPNPGGKYRPGERVCALLPLKGDEKG